MSSNSQHIANMLAAAIVCPPLDCESIESRIAKLLGKRFRWSKSLAQRFVQAFPDGGLRPRRKQVAEWLLSDRGYQKALERHDLTVANAITGSDGMLPIMAAQQWDGIPPINSLSQLRDWLELEPQELDWFTDQKKLVWRSTSEKLWHYRNRILNKRFGQVRVIEAPKPRLKAIQLKILLHILNLVPPHFAAHGFRRGHSIVTFAKPHVAQSVVMSMDLMDFFPTIGYCRVNAIFRSLGYPESVSEALTSLCVTALPKEYWHTHMPVDSTPRKRDQWSRYCRQHLPQGAPTSPALANLVAFRLDRRLSSLASVAGVHYTRYADDLVFSGDQEFARRIHQFSTYVSVIVREEGFLINHSKTRFMKSGTQQRAAGVVVNQCTNGRRAEFDELKAILTNCVRHGPNSQNRRKVPQFRSHLLGRIAHWQLLNPIRGEKLRRIFDQIVWC